MSKNKVVVIGAGFSGISVASYLAKKGFKVTILEKNAISGGRARSFSGNGFTFDMGPSWYWMPDVFDKYFAGLGKKRSDYYQLKQLDPSYSVVFGKNDLVQIPANYDQLCALFESLEKGSTQALKKFLEQAAYKYEVGMNQLVYKPSRSFTEFISARLLYDIMRMDVFKPFSKHVRGFFKHRKILQIMEFPILLLGALPQDTPALYSLMNYADIKLGTWYPAGGMHKIITGMVQLATELGVEIIHNQNVKSLDFTDHTIKKVKTETDEFDADIVVASADYHHVETELLPASHQSYSAKYWETRKLAPSSLIFYLGLNRKLKNLTHHNLFFDEDFMPHARDIYENKQWPENPLFYLSVTSKTDDTVAPKGCENLFVLIPVAPDLPDTETIRDKYYEQVIKRIENITGQAIRDAIVFKRSYAHNDFISDYNAFKGNAYGLANTLMQTAILKPGLKSKKVKNLFYTGQFTVPGPGVPPALISGKVVAEEIEKEY